MKKKASFKEELRRSLIIHVLLPCLIFILVLLSCFLYLIFGVVSKNNKENGKNAAKKFVMTMNGYRDEVKKFTWNLKFNQFKMEKRYQTKEIEKVYKVLNENEVRADFYLFDSKKEVIFSTQSSKEVLHNIGNYIGGSYENIVSEKSPYRYLYSVKDIDFEPISSYVISEIIKENNEKAHGICAYVLDLKRFIATREFKTTGIVMVNRYGRVIFENGFDVSDERGKIEEKFKGNSGLLHKEGNYYFVTIMKTGIEGIVIYTFSDCTLYVNLFFAVSVVSILLLTIVVLVILRSSKKFSDNKTILIYELIDGLKKVEDGDLSVRLNFDTKDEFEDIGNGFNMMIESIRDLLKRHEDLTRENIQSMVMALESQFNPHFLFNTLESIKYMIQLNPTGAGKMLVNLSKLLRYSIENENEFVSIEEEVDFLEHYMNVMFVRYGERLRYQCEVEKKFQEVFVPKMILQPIVENSIKYGFGDSRMNLEILVKIKIIRESLVLEIEDNGVGIEGELLERLRKNLDAGYNKSAHIGIYNVNKRIQLLYGREYGLKIDSEMGKGTKVILKLPLQKEGDFGVESGYSRR